MAKKSISFLADVVDEMALVEYMRSNGGMFYSLGRKQWIDAPIDSSIGSELVIKVFSEKCEHPNEDMHCILLQPSRKNMVLLGHLRNITIGIPALNKLYRLTGKYIEQHFSLHDTGRYYVGNNLREQWLRHEIVCHTHLLYSKAYYAWFDSRKEAKQAYSTFVDTFFQKGYCVAFSEKRRNSKTNMETEEWIDPSNVIYPPGAKVLTFEREWTESWWDPYDLLVSVSRESEVVFIRLREGRRERKRKWFISFAADARFFDGPFYNKAIVDLFSQICSYFEDASPEEHARCSSIKKRSDKERKKQRCSKFE